MASDIIAVIERLMQGAEKAGQPGEMLITLIFPDCLAETFVLAFQASNNSIVFTIVPVTHSALIEQVLKKIRIPP